MDESRPCYWSRCLIDCRQAFHYKNNVNTSHWFTLGFNFPGGFKCDHDFPGRLGAFLMLITTPEFVRKNLGARGMAIVSTSKSSMSAKCCAR